ncbi:MAG: metal ABC transporter substrate-binding protein, partial [Muribaculaceae bacterium]|nr:metal ABC transporter substrate-binding protein [Muribaculaceae bacterium]
MKSYLPEYFSIESFVKPGESAMWFSVNDSNISLLKNADAFIYFNSYLFEHRVSERLKREYPSVKLLPSGQSLPRFMDGFFVGKIQINDPQMFQSIRNSRRAVIESAKRLSESFPEFEKEIMKRAEIREERLHHLDDSLSNALAPLYYSSFVTIHPLLGHFEKDYGLN